MPARKDREVYIERATKDKEHPYGMLLRSNFDGSNLSFEARGVLAYILMKPDNWKTNVKDIMREGKIGRDQAYRIVNELIDNGYAERVEVRNDQGQIVGTVTRVHETPLPEKPYTVEPHTAEPLAENTEHNNNGVIPITDQQPITEKPKKKIREAAPPHANTQPIIQTYIELIGFTPARSKMAKVGMDAKDIAKRGYGSEDVRQAYDIVHAEPFWRDKVVPLSVVLEKLEKLRMTIRNRTEVSNGWLEDDGGWSAEELAALKAARDAGDRELAGRIVREGNQRWLAKMSKVQ